MYKNTNGNDKLENLKKKPANQPAKSDQSYHTSDYKKIINGKQSDFQKWQLGLLDHLVCFFLFFFVFFFSKPG